jgi:GT2 family glycosyltransferase
MRTGAVIVTYNSAGHIGPCLDSCLAHAPSLTGGIVVVDNCSSDATLDEVRSRPGVTLIANPFNAGFAAAVNQGFAALPAAEAVLLLNPDTQLISPPSVLWHELENAPRAAAAAGLLLSPSGAPQLGFQFRRLPTPAALIFETLGLNRLCPSNPINRRYRALDLDPALPAENIQPPGACLLIRRAAWQQLRGFDEGFHPLWFEDVDFVKRLLDSGWRVLYVPAFRAVHCGGHSIARLRTASRQLYWYNSLLRYACLHFGTAGRVLTCWAVMLGILPRAVTGMLLERSGQSISAYGRLVRLAVTCLWGGASSTCSPGMASRASLSVCEPAGTQKRSGL